MTWRSATWLACLTCTLSVACAPERNPESERFLAATMWQTGPRPIVMLGGPEDDVPLYQVLGAVRLGDGRLVVAVALVGGVLRSQAGSRP